MMQVVMPALSRGRYRAYKRFIEADEHKIRTLRSVDTFDMLLTGSSCFLYVIETYWTHDYEILWCLEVLISASLTLIYVQRVRLSPEPFAKMLQPSAMIDLVTSLPVLISMILTPYSMNAYAVLRVLRVLRTFSLASDFMLQPLPHQASLIVFASAVHISHTHFSSLS